ncbi:MAG: DUF975 family protein [Candidatus Moraniibacteriota bacterium]
MKTENKVLMQQARETLNGKWGVAVGGFAIYSVIVIAIDLVPVIGPLANLFIAGPLAGGLVIFSLALSRNQEAKFEQLLEGFNDFFKYAVAYWRIVLLVLLWSLLLIVPGIIVAFSYALVFYILADDSSISVKEAFEKSKAMMLGYKWKYFCLGLRFLGWALLCIPTFGLGLLWLLPYMQVSLAKFYDDLKGEQTSSETAAIVASPQPAATENPASVV